MARHYSTKDFFRQMPPSLLFRYFQRHGLLTGFDFGAIQEGKPEALFAAWLELPERERHAMEANALTEVANKAATPALKMVMGNQEKASDEPTLEELVTGRKA